MSSTPKDLEVEVAKDLTSALQKRGGTVTHDGRPGRPDIVVETDHFAIVVEVALRSGADAASEYLAIRDHRDLVERETGKPTHLLFGCTRTPTRIVRAMREENADRVAKRRRGRVLFLDLASLEIVLGRMATAAASLYPIDRLDMWFESWETMADDITALERFHAQVLSEDDQLGGIVGPMVSQRMQVEQEALRRDVSGLEDLLRHVNVTRTDAMQVLIYTMFVKLYEEKREGNGEVNRFTEKGFVEYRKGMTAKARRENSGRTLQFLLEEELAQDADVAAAKLLAGVKLPRAINDTFVETKLLPVLERYRFRGTHLDALGAVFEALARRAEKDTRIGQFFTPEPIVRFAVDIARPGPTERVLDPAAGTGRFLAWSMEQMVARAGEVAGTPRSQVLRSIYKERLLGTDADPWIVTIAKMNMYIHGDGKSNICHENGLFLADLPVFDGRRTLLDKVDVCLTNPPLGEMSYSAYAQDLVGRGASRFSDPAAWLRARLPLLPGGFAEEKAIAALDRGIRLWSERVRLAIKAGDERAELRGNRYKTAAEEKRATLKARLASGEGTYEASGRTAKGGALFLAAIKDYLKPRRDPSAEVEWQGGRVAIVVDEALLNTAEYAEARRFVRTHYFIKAVISFSRDAFWYQARTTAKTSLLYLFRKPDVTVVQREPVFFCHVDRIGFDRLGKPEESDLPLVLDAYRGFEKAVRAAYQGSAFKETKAKASVNRLSLPSAVRIQWDTGARDARSRLDYAFEAATQLRASLPGDHVPLGHFVESVIRTPPEDPLGVYSFATVNRNTGEVRNDRVDSTKYDARELRVIHAGDIVVSGIDIVHGAVGFAQPDVHEHVVSKEFYTLRVRPENAKEVDPRYLALLLRTPHAQELLAGMVTGTSNRTRVESADMLLSLPLPPLPDFVEQQALSDAVDAALSSRRSARADLSSAVVAANEAWQQGRSQATSL